MNSLSGKRALVIGGDSSGAAAASLLRRRGAQVTLASAEGPVPPMSDPPDKVIMSVGCGDLSWLDREKWPAGVEWMGERELAFAESFCLHVAITGANGKSTTAELVARVLRLSGRRVEVACGVDRPASALVEGSRDLDFLVHGVEAMELSHLRTFRPVVGVLLNAPSDHPESSGTWDEYLRGLAQLFIHQQAFDWAIVQSEALAHLRAVGSVPPGKIITFSATSRQADLGVERGMLVSRLEGWTGRLWDMSRGHLRGPHFAEDALAALAVGRVLRLALDEMTPALDAFVPGPGRFELLGEADGVRYFDDGRSSNLDALAKALVTLAPISPENPFVWLIAGGDIAGRQFYDLGPLISPRVKQVLVFGEAAAAMRAAWSLFTPCSPMDSLLDAANWAASHAVRGDVVLYSPACPRRANQAPSLLENDVFRNVVRGRLGQPSAGGSPWFVPSGPPAAAGSSFSEVRSLHPAATAPQS